MDLRWVVASEACAVSASNNARQNPRTGVGGNSFPLCCVRFAGDSQAALQCRWNGTRGQCQQRLTRSFRGAFSSSDPSSGIGVSAQRSSRVPEGWQDYIRNVGKLKLRLKLSPIISHTVQAGYLRCGSILAELDRAAARKQHQEVKAAAAHHEAYRPDEPHVEYPTWGLLQKVAAHVLASVIACAVLPSCAHAIAENSIGASSFGLKVAQYLRASGLPDELVVLIVAMLPVLELRGAIPISYWMKLPPVNGFVLAVIGNMIPVPFIVLYLEKLSNFLAGRSKTGQRLVQWVFDVTKTKVGPIEEFAWLGLLLFVAVPLPGTGAWSGAIAASILGMPFWDAMTANFLGVLIAGVLVNIFVTVGTELAIFVGTVVFVGSFFMWSGLRRLQPKKSA